MERTLSSEQIREITEVDYNLLCKQLTALSEDEPFWLPVLSNAAALLYNALPVLNWAGFYLMDQGSLVLGPFQGKVACVRIALGKGVCGTAAAENRTQRIENVHEFPGHIACDSASNSELVIPVHKDGKVMGVLDIDSPCLSRFTERDQEGLERFVRILEQMCVFRSLS